MYQMSPIFDVELYIIISYEIKEQRYFRGSGFHCTDYTKHGHIKKSGKGVV